MEIIQQVIFYLRVPHGNSTEQEGNENIACWDIIGNMGLVTIFTLPYKYCFLTRLFIEKIAKMYCFLPCWPDIIDITHSFVTLV